MGGIALEGILMVAKRNGLGLRTCWSTGPSDDGMVAEPTAHGLTGLELFEALLPLGVATAFGGDGISQPIVKPPDPT